MGGSCRGREVGIHVEFRSAEDGHSRRCRLASAVRSTRGAHNRSQSRIRSCETFATRLPTPRHAPGWGTRIPAQWESVGTIDICTTKQDV